MTIADVTRPGMFTVNFGSPSIEDPMREMNAAQTLEAYGTTSIGIDVMLDRIRQATPTVLENGRIIWTPADQLNAWLFFEMIPRETGIREIALAAMEGALKEHRNRKLTEQNRVLFIRWAHLEIQRRLVVREHMRWFATMWRNVSALVCRDAGIPDADVDRALNEDG